VKFQREINGAAAFDLRRKASLIFERFEWSAHQRYGNMLARIIRGVHHV